MKILFHKKSIILNEKISGMNDKLIDFILVHYENFKDIVNNQKLVLELVFEIIKTYNTYDENFNNIKYNTLSQISVKLSKFIYN
jgi:hypothetical protein